ncbi:MAG TPA: glycerophosphodiester phosphodiesterase [Candidatus Limnocylindrales bacterium]
MDRSPRSTPRRDAPIGFAHRGASAHARENTLEAFALALELGATGLESDAWLSADGVPVLVHDRTIRRPGRRVDVTRRTAAELAEFRVPSLADLYAAVGTAVELSLDIEHEDVALPVVDVASGHSAEDRLWACSPSLRVLRSIRRRSPRVRVVCSTRPRRIVGGVRALLPELVGLGADALNLHWRDWSPALVDQVHEAGLLALGWDAQERGTIASLLELGIDALYSDWPDRVVEVIAARRMEPGPAEGAPAAMPAGGL